MATANKEFLDAYLEVGIGHYYTLTKILSSRISGELSETERLSVGLEISAQTSASFDNLVTWYHALLRWDPRGETTPLADVLEAIAVEDSLRLEAFQHVTNSRADQFARAFKIPWTQADLRGRRLDVTNWRYTVDQAKQNIAKVFEDMSPAEATTPRGWIAKYMGTVGRQPLFGGGRYGAIPRVHATSEDGDLASTDEGTIVIPTDTEMLSQLVELTGNAAIGLFLLVRLSYVSAFYLEPRSPAFVTIWQEMHPARGQGP